MNRWINCAQCNAPMADRAMCSTDGVPFCSGRCQMAFAEQTRQARREQSQRRTAALERQADQAMMVKAGLVALAVLVSATLMGSSGFDAPGDHFGPDERSHVAAGRMALR